MSKRTTPSEKRPASPATPGAQRRCRRPSATHCAKRRRRPRDRRVNPEFFGIGAEQAFARTGAERAAILDQIAASRVSTIRQVLHWSHIERSPGRYDFAHTDRYVADVAQRGLSIMAVLFDPPRFRTQARPGDLGTATFPPSSNAEFATFAAMLVRRYGTAGSFWRENPDLPPRPIRMWQVWNEPSLSVNWPTGVSPEEYAAMLATVGSALHAADPGAEVITGGLPDTRRALPLRRFIRRLYAAGGGGFDTLGVNAYAGDADGVVEVTTRVRRLLDALGAREVPIRISEFGWATDGTAPHRLNVGPSGQARLIAEAYPLLAARRKRLGLKSAYLWNWMDLPPAQGQTRYWGNHAGLIDRAGNEKPGLAALQRTVQALLP